MLFAALITETRMKKGSFDDMFPHILEYIFAKARQKIQDRTKGKVIISRPIRGQSSKP